MAEPPYEVLINAREWERLRKSAPRNIIEAARAFRDDFLAWTPEDISAAGHRLKRLHGSVERFYQYDLPGYYRLRYTVDREAMIVRVEYIGPHPD